MTEELNIPFAGTQVTLDELKRVDELILVGTTTEVVPVVRVDGDPIGTGRPGPITGRLRGAYEASVKAWLAEEPRRRPAPAQVRGVE